MILYIKTDVLLSVDVFEKFRAMCLEYYEKHPCYTYSTPGLTWLCVLKYTKVRLNYYKKIQLTFMIQYNMALEVG